MTNITLRYYVANNPIRTLIETSVPLTDFRAMQISIAKAIEKKQVLRNISRSVQVSVDHPLSQNIDNFDVEIVVQL